MRIDVTTSGSDGERDVAVIAPAGTTLAQVAALLPDCSATDEVLGYPGLVAGARLGRSPRTPPSGHRLVVVGGIGAGRAVRLGTDPVVVGRAGSCGLALPDPQLSRRHLAVRLGPRGAVVRDLGSANGTTIDGSPVSTDERELVGGALIRAGDTFLEVVSATGRVLPVRPGRGGGALVAPAPARAPLPAAPPVPLPTPPDLPPREPVQWLAALAPAIAAGILAAVLGTWTFLLLAVLSPVAVLGAALGNRWRGRRSRRRMRGDHALATRQAAARLRTGLRAEERLRRAHAPDPAEVALIAAGPGSRLWERRNPSEVLLHARLGLGDAPSRLCVTGDGPTRPAGIVTAVPYHLDLAAGPLALEGPAEPCRAIARWLVAQLATFVAPVYLEVAVITDRPDDWRWLRWLPHWTQRVATGPAQERALAAELSARAQGGEPRRWLLLVVDGCAAPAAVTRLLDTAARDGLAVIWIGRGGSLPASRLIRGTLDGSGTRLRLPDNAMLVADEVDLAWAEALARTLAPLAPDLERAAALPSRIRLRELVPASVAWQVPGSGLPFVIGCGSAGPFVLDLVRDGPHALVAGTTGAGKSELLRTMIASLALAHPPDRLTFVLIDYKGGAAFADCARLPHVTGCVTDLDGHLTARALRSLERELRRREGLLAAAGVADVESYLKSRTEDTAALARLVIVVDEFAALAEELPDFVAGLVGIAQRGRSLGIHLVLATQRPGGVVSPEIRANASLRIALRVTDAAESRDVIDVDDAALLDRRTPGRAVVRIAGGDLATVQVATVSAPPPLGGGDVRVVELDGWRRPLRPEREEAHASDLTDIVSALTAAAAVQARPRVAPPWLAPLPDTVHAPPVPSGPGADVAGVTLGLADLPDEQRQAPFVVDIAGGGAVVIAGGPRSGRTSALLTVALQAARRHSPQDLQISVVDPAGGLAALAALPHTGSVVADAAATAALLRRLATAEPGQECGPGSGQGSRRRFGVRHLLLVDDLERVIAASEQFDDGASVEVLLALLRSAASSGPSLAVAGGRAALQPRIAAGVGTRLVLRIPDPGDYVLAGLAPKAVPGHLPPGRAVACPEGTEVQLFAPPADPRGEVRALAARWPGAVAAQVVIRPLPDRVALAELPRMPGRVVLGLGGDAARPLSIDLFGGSGRLLVCGPPGSGRSTVLVSMRVQASDSGWRVVTAGSPRSPLGHSPPEDIAAAAGVDGPLLILVDDAEDLADSETEAQLTGALTGRERDGLPTALVAATTPEQAVIGYRGAVASARRDRCLILLHPGPADAALVGQRIPRHVGMPPPGRGLVLGSRRWGPPFASGPQVLQVAQPDGQAGPAMCG